MKRCTYCGHVLTLTDEDCPMCMTAEIDAEPVANMEDVPHAPPSAALPVARFANAAEAGYFAHELSAAGLDVALNVEENFDAVTGHWAMRFVLTAPAAEADAAAEALRDLVNATDSMDESEAEEHFGLDEHHDLPDEPQDIDGGSWFAVLLVITAGSLAAWGMRQFLKPENPPPGRQHTSLWDRLSESPEPWTQWLGPGGGRRELRIDRLQKWAVLREDHDGDGRFERVTRLPLPTRDQ